MNVEDIPLNARSLSFKRASTRYVVSFDSENLTVDRQSGTFSSTTKTPLCDLCPELRRERWISESALRLGREARYLLLVSVVVYFSAVHQYVPLLAPLSLVLGLFLAYQAHRQGWPPEKTIIDSDTEPIVTIPHFKRIESARKAFEDALGRVIKRAREEAEEEES